MGVSGFRSGLGRQANVRVMRRMIPMITDMAR